MSSTEKKGSKPKQAAQNSSPHSNDGSKSPEDAGCKPALSVKPPSTRECKTEGTLSMASPQRNRRGSEECRQGSAVTLCKPKVGGNSSKNMQQRRRSADSQPIQSLECRRQTPMPSSPKLPKEKEVKVEKNEENTADVSSGKDRRKTKVSLTPAGTGQCRPKTPGAMSPLSERRHSLTTPTMSKSRRSVSPGPSALPPLQSKRKFRLNEGPNDASKLSPCLEKVSPKDDRTVSSLSNGGTSTSCQNGDILPSPRTERRRLSRITERRFSTSLDRYPSSVATKPAFSRVRRSLSFSVANTASTGGRLLEQECINKAGSSWAKTMLENGEEGSNSVESLRNLNLELRDQVTKLRYHLDAQRGSIKQVQWQKVLDIRHVRQQGQQRLTMALKEQREKMEKEKVKELEQMSEQLTKKAESDHCKLSRRKDAEISKLKLEVSSKDDMIRRLLGENRHALLKLNIDVRKAKLLDELKDLRQEKKMLEESLSSASVAERSFSSSLMKTSQNFETEIARVRREAQMENSQLVSF